MIKNFIKSFYFYKKLYIFSEFYSSFSLHLILQRLSIKVVRYRWQLTYIANNWIYSTNHKRISINYFWFVLLAAVVGTVLATMVRVEMAYPGVGILAGDNAQYLSIATGHGVVMVFFVAMPVLFGFFTNFLLPTQLGVHDVAFPRMNSAAFWFLPASLIILCQLVCVDRRYQRMNVYNVRELQSLLRNKFFIDLLNTNDYRALLGESLVGSRFNTNLENGYTSGSNQLTNVGPNVIDTFKNVTVYGNTSSVIRYGIRRVEKVYNWRTREFEKKEIEVFVNPWSELKGNVFGNHQIWLAQLISTKNFYFLLSKRTLGNLQNRPNLKSFTDVSTCYIGETKNVRRYRKTYCFLVLEYFLSVLFGMLRSLYRFVYYSEKPRLFTKVVTASVKSISEFITKTVQYTYAIVIFTKSLLKFSFIAFLWTLRRAIYALGFLKRFVVAIFTKTLELDYLGIWRFFCVKYTISVENYRASRITNSAMLISWVRSLFPFDLGFVLRLLKGYENSIMKARAANPTVRELYSSAHPNLTITTALNGSIYGNLLSTFRYLNLDRYNQVRYQQHNYPSSEYRVRIGNYLPDLHYDSYSHMLNTFNSKGIGVRKSNWFFSQYVKKELSNQIKFDRNVYENFFNVPRENISDKPKLFINHNAIFHYYDVLLDRFKVNNLLLTPLTDSTALSKKYQNLLFSQSKQTTVLNNWRKLKLTREGWRCRMLASRNQNSLYRRFIDENTLVIVVEKNAKDLLPGWAMITPFSSRTKYTLVGKTDIGIMVVTITLFASMVSGCNFLITYRYLSTLNNRKMRDARCFFIEAIIASIWMTVAANPMLILALLMLISDRHWKTSFFDYSGGGDTILFQHMFWFFGHPEVYIIMIPCFGFTNTILSFYLRKRISARASLIYSIYTIAFLGFFVWGHHMYMVGLAHTTRMLYSTLTVMISVPAATKIMHWLVTFINSTVHFELPLMWTLMFVFYFVTGGMSGMSVAHTGMNVLFHDSMYVIGHFHVMLAGSLMFSVFAAIYFYLPAIFGVRYSRIFAYLHFIYYVVGQLFTVIPMLWVGYAGMPRRVLDYPAALGGWHSLSTSAHFLSIAGVLCFIIMLFESLRKKRSYHVKTFGIGRYNTRLNFYLYENQRSKYWVYKTFYLNSVFNYKKINNYPVNSINIENYDSTLFFYTLNK